MSATDTKTRRIWLGCLAAYNAGNLHGEWVDADEALEAAKDRILAASPVPNAEEWFIADHEGFGELIGEYTPLEEVARIDAALTEAAEYVPLDAVVAYIDYMGGIDYIDDCEDAYCGVYRDGGEYAAQLAEEVGDLPDDSPYVHYIDWDAMWRDMRIGDGYWSADTGDGDVYIFRPV